MTAADGAGAGREMKGALDARLTETQERFLRDAALRLPLERVAELHVFPPIRQGGVETGIAVVAAHRAPAPEPEPDGDVASAGASAGAGEASVSGDAVVADGVPGRGEMRVAGAAGSGSDDAREHDEGAPPQVEDAQSEVGERDRDDAHRSMVVQPAGDAEPAARGDDERLTVFSARYRHTLKGPDRGRWEVEVVEEADAPLASVDLVVRGVQRRAGEGAEPERLSAAQLRALLPDAPPG